MSRLKALLKKLKPDPYRGMNTAERFNTIYRQNDWKDDESVSGPGSNATQVETVKSILHRVLEEYSISSMADIPCGDFGWMRDVDLGEVSYVGGDIVEDLIQLNRDQYGNRANVSFEVIDLLLDPIPEVDLLFVRDCLVHLNHNQVQTALRRIANSSCQFLLTTSFVEHGTNIDIHTGDWRPLNLEQPPFNLPKPLAVFNEKCTENNGKYADKSLVLWKISDLPRS